jgi:hypothetical protein
MLSALCVIYAYVSEWGGGCFGNGMEVVHQRGESSNRIFDLIQFMQTHFSAVKYHQHL